MVNIVVRNAASKIHDRRRKSKSVSADQLIQALGGQKTGAAIKNVSAHEVLARFDMSKAKQLVINISQDDYDRLSAIVASPELRDFNVSTPVLAEKMIHIALAQESFIAAMAKQLKFG